jgi:hypothetical protein
MGWRVFTVQNPQFCALKLIDSCGKYVCLEYYWCTLKNLKAILVVNLMIEICQSTRKYYAIEKLIRKEKTGKKMRLCKKIEIAKLKTPEGPSAQ